MARFEAMRVLRFGDCDPAGIAYFPRYFDLLNGVVEDWWGAMGHPWKTVFGRRRIGLPTVRFEAEFRAPAFLEDELRFSLSVKRIGGKSVDLDHSVQRDGTLLWQASQTLVVTSLETHRSIAWPDDLRAALVAFQEAPRCTPSCSLKAG
jgi:4-hydroxybenzoyl-CoA thioesterase